MQIHISANDGVPIYLQIVNQIKYLIASGRLKAEEELPPIRVLAERLIVNPNTVARAYRELEAAGLVEKRRTAGTYVSDQGSPLARRQRVKILSGRIDALLAEARQMDVHFDELIQLIEQRKKPCKPPATRNDLMNEPFPCSAPPIVNIRRLTRQFGNKTALDNVSLAVPRGGVFGLIGGNGAGKTTLIKHILGMLKPQTGSVQVFGLDPVQNPVGTLGRIGYLSEDRDLPNWMRVGELIRYTQAFFPTWDEAYAEELRKAFDLDDKAQDQDAFAGPAGTGRAAGRAGASAGAARPG